MTKSQLSQMTKKGLVGTPGFAAQKAANKVTLRKCVVRKVLHVLIEAYKEKRGRFKEIHHTTHGPQHVHVPGVRISVKGFQEKLFESVHLQKKKRNAPRVNIGSLKHQQYLYLVTPTDHMQDSAALYSNHVRLYADHPWIYSEKVLGLTKEKLALIFREYKIGLPNENARFWIGNAQTLFVDFAGDPVELFKACGSTVDGVQKWRKAYEKKHGRNPLLGFEKKITSLYLLYLAEFGVLPFPEDAFAVDVHVIFQLYQAEAFVLHERTNSATLAEVLREIICEICIEDNLDKIMLANAIWLNGSFGCNGCSKNAAAPIQCPLWNMCTGRYATDNYHHNGTLDPSDPLFPKGGQWPKYGVPQITRRRPEVKGLSLIHI